MHFTTQYHVRDIHLDQISGLTFVLSKIIFDNIGYLDKISYLCNMVSYQKQNLRILK